MYLQLAEDTTLAKRYTNVKKYFRNSHTTAGHNVKAHRRQLSEEPENPYIFIPDKTGTTKGIWIREDQFDWMSPLEWRQFVAELAPYQPEVIEGGMSENIYLASRATRKAKRAVKQKKKELNKEHRAEVRTQRGETIKNLFGTIGGVAKNIFGQPEAPAGGEEAGGGGAPPEKEPFNYTPILIGAGVLALAGGVYYFTRE